MPPICLPLRLIIGVWYENRIKCTVCRSILHTVSQIDHSLAFERVAVHILLCKRRLKNQYEYSR